MQQIHSQLIQFLRTSPSQASLTIYINSMRPNITPTIYFHEIKPYALTELTPVYINLMVQDIRDSFFYYSLVIKRPFTEDYTLLKFGNVAPATEDMLDNPQYLKVMTDRDQVICTPLPHTCPWVNRLQHHLNTQSQIQLFVDGKCNFKLGETIYAVAMYCPQANKLYYVRQCSKEEVNRISPRRQLQFHHKYSQVRSQLLHFLMKFTTQKYAYYMLYSMLSKDHMFITCDNNLYKLVSLLLPRVCNLQMKHPFKQSLFPYQDQDSVLHKTPLQLSVEHTYVIVDFSNLSSAEQVKIEGEEIDNLKALRIFVDEGNTIYRWQGGESSAKHSHTGMVVRATNILSPQFKLLEQSTQLNQELLEKTNEETYMLFRAYIQAARQFNPVLSEEEVGRVQEKINQYLAGSPTKVEITLTNRMKIAKISAMSKGSNCITVEDYIDAVKLVY